MQKDKQKYIRHAIRREAKDGKEKDRSSDADIPARVKAAYREKEVLAREKIILAKRLMYLATRAGLRLERDLARIMALQGDQSMSQEHVEVRGGYVVNPAPLVPTVGAPIVLEVPVIPRVGSILDSSVASNGTDSSLIGANSGGPVLKSQFFCLCHQTMLIISQRDV